MSSGRESASERRWRRFRSVVWSLRPDFRSYVAISPQDDILIYLHHDHTANSHSCMIYLSRSTARLLARRINECLDATRAK